MTTVVGSLRKGCYASVTDRGALIPHTFHTVESENGLHYISRDIYTFKKIL